MFKTETSVPRIYPEKSRDFQLLCRLTDMYVNGLLGNIDRLKYQLSNDLCDERFTGLLADKVGFFTDEYLPDDVFRSIISVFPYVRKNKGNSLGIKTAVIAALSPYKNFMEGEDLIKVDADNDTHEVVITIKCSKVFDFDSRYLREVLKYCLPTGYFIHVIEKDPSEKDVYNNYITL